MDELGLKRYCCRRMILTHVDLVDKLLSYQVGLPQAECAACLYAGQRPAVPLHLATRPRPPRARRPSRRRRPRRASGDEVFAQLSFARPTMPPAKDLAAGRAASSWSAGFRIASGSPDACGLDGRGRACIGTSRGQHAALRQLCVAGGARSMQTLHRRQCRSRAVWRPAPAHRESATSDCPRRQRGTPRPRGPCAFDAVRALGRKFAAGEPQWRGLPHPAPFAALRRSPNRTRFGSGPCGSSLCCLAVTPYGACCGDGLRLIAATPRWEGPR